MVELVEYALVVLASSLLVAGSIATYGSFSSLQSNLQLRATSGTISEMVSRAVINGGSQGRVDLPAFTLSCARGVLTVSSGSSSVTAQIPVDCSFSQKISAGQHMITFVRQGSSLSLSVS